MNTGGGPRGRAATGRGQMRRPRSLLLLLLLMSAFTTSAYALGMESGLTMRLGGSGDISIESPTGEDVHATMFFNGAGLFFYQIDWEPVESGLYEIQVLFRDSEGEVVGIGTAQTENPADASPRTDWIDIAPAPPLQDIADVQVTIRQCLALSGMQEEASC